ncbi:MAG: NUDIX domain-containing protein [Aeromonas popoffii]|uniref:NUDIX domain-containing protein n=1 Tax=Aeromonas popoffii TaxID=70856 RepID=UPI003F41995E
MRNAAFVMFHCQNLVLMTMRADGHWGFPGGKQEEGESIFEAAKRECLEEINVNISLDGVEYQGSHVIREDFHSHFFTRHTSYAGLILALEAAMSGHATHGDEVNGVALFDIERQDFYKMPLAHTVIDELEQVFGDRLKKEA